MKTRIQQILKKNFSFFNGQISPNFGTPCCKYGQQGKPLAFKKVQEAWRELQDNLQFWNLNEEHTKLNKFVFLTNYYMSPRIIREIIAIDEMDTRNQPCVSVLNGDLLKIEVFSNSIGGLSMVDFELALKLNSIDFPKFGGIELKTDKNYRMEIRMMKNEEENRKVRASLELAD